MTTTSQSPVFWSLRRLLGATAFGLVIAMVALLPFNYLNARLEQARHEIETASAQLEMLLLRNEKKAELVA